MSKKEVKLIVGGIILSEARNKILLIRRADSMWGDAWSIPGGHVEYGETVKEALIRELQEELNLKVLDMRFLAYEEFIVPTKPDKQFVSLNFIVFAKEGISPNKEIKEARWFDLRELSEIDHKIPKEGVEYLNKLLKKQTNFLISEMTTKTMLDEGSCGKSV